MRLSLTHVLTYLHCRPHEGHRFALIDQQKVYGPNDLLPHMQSTFGNNHVISGVVMDLRQLAENASHASLVEGLNVSVITKNCKYFYYCCDGTDDRVSICI